jgi:hypothetical protein
MTQTLMEPGTVQAGLQGALLREIELRHQVDAVELLAVLSDTDQRDLRRAVQLLLWGGAIDVVPADGATGSRAGHQAGHRYRVTPYGHSLVEEYRCSPGRSASVQRDGQLGAARHR